MTIFSDVLDHVIAHSQKGRRLQNDVPEARTFPRKILTFRNMTLDLLFYEL